MQPQPEFSGLSWEPAPGSAGEGFEPLCSHRDPEGPGCSRVFMPYGNGLFYCPARKARGMKANPSRGSPVCPGTPQNAGAGGLGWLIQPPLEAGALKNTGRNRAVTPQAGSWPAALAGSASGRADRQTASRLIPPRPGASRSIPALPGASRCPFPLPARSCSGGRLGLGKGMCVFLLQLQG